MLDKTSNANGTVSMTIIKKQQSKAVKGNKNAKDFKEGFDASEETGQRHANNLRDNNLEEIKKRKKAIMGQAEPETSDFARASTRLNKKK